MVRKEKENKNNRQQLESTIYHHTLWYSNMASWKIPGLTGGVLWKISDKWSIFQQAMA